MHVAKFKVITVLPDFRNSSLNKNRKISKMQSRELEGYMHLTHLELTLENN